MIFNGVFRAVRFGKRALAGLFFVSLAIGTSARGETPPAYRTIPDVVYGHKDGLGLTLDVLIPEKDPKHLGIILVSSGSWRSSKSNVAEENVRREKDHWVQGLLSGGYTLFVARHGSARAISCPR